MTGLNAAAAKGHYAQKQIFSKARLIAWSHRRRFELAVRVAGQFAGKRVLDFGCGDGTFLAMLLASRYPPLEATGAEVRDDLVEDCRTRLGTDRRLRFVHISDLHSTDNFDAVFCMEVLEHVVAPETVLRRLKTLLAPGGRVAISVPVETGLPLLVKQTARRIAGWRGIGDYPGISPYTWPEFVRSVFAGPRPHIPRPVHRHPDGHAWHDHKGFNWMALRELIQQHFEIRDSFSSPVAALPPHFGSQAWFVLAGKNS
jgi:SAM-dependent methyltransferase